MISAMRGWVQGAGWGKSEGFQLGDGESLCVHAQSSKEKLRLFHNALSETIFKLFSLNSKTVFYLCDRLDVNGGNNKATVICQLRCTDISHADIAKNAGCTNSTAYEVVASFVATTRRLWLYINEVELRTHSL